MFKGLFFLLFGEPARITTTFAGLDAVIVDVLNHQLAYNDEWYGEEHSGGAEQFTARVEQYEKQAAKAEAEAGAAALRPMGTNVSARPRLRERCFSRMVFSFERLARAGRHCAGARNRCRLSIIRRCRSRSCCAIIAVFGLC